MEKSFEDFKKSFTDLVMTDDHAILCKDFYDLMKGFVTEKMGDLSTFDAKILDPVSDALVVAIGGILSGLLLAHSDTPGKMNRFLFALSLDIRMKFLSMAQDFPIWAMQKQIPEIIGIEEIERYNEEEKPLKKHEMN